MSADARPQGSAARGWLRIYLGYAPGAGTTCALLSEGRRRAEHGTDVVVARADTHGRPHTEDLLAGLEVIPVSLICAHARCSIRQLGCQDAACGRCFFRAPRPGRGIGYVVSMQPAAWPEPDPQIAAAVAAMYARRKAPRPLAVQIRDRLGQWLSDEEFASAFGDRGRPGWSPSRLALVTVLQRAEKLTDRLAATRSG